METIDIPQDIIKLLTDERIEYFRTLFCLDECRVNGKYLIMQGSRRSLDTAISMSKAHFHGLRKKLNQAKSTSVYFPRSCEISESDMQIILGADAFDLLKFEFLKNSVKISGGAAAVDDAVEKTSHYLSAFGDEQESTSRKDNKPSSSSSRHKSHQCFFCQLEFTSRYFRTHVTEKCTKGFAGNLTKEEKDELVGLFYKGSKNSTDNFESKFRAYKETYAFEEHKRPLGEVKEELDSQENRVKISSNAEAKVKSESNVDHINQFRMDELVKSYEKWMTSRAGDSGLSGNTQNSRLQDLKKLVNKCNVDLLSDLMLTDSIIHLTEKIDRFQVLDSTKYDYALAAIRFLEYCQTDHECISNSKETEFVINKALKKWDRIRISYQRGLIKERKQKRSANNRAMEEGSFPTLAEIAECEQYFLKKLPNIKSARSLSPTSLQHFYCWLGFSMAANNALRPSSIGNMTTSEYDHSFHRHDEEMGSVKIVEVQGNVLLF